MIECPDCIGGLVTCRDCNGDGLVTIDYYDEDGNFLYYEKENCPFCHGVSPWKGMQTCITCNGTADIPNFTEVTQQKENTKMETKGFSFTLETLLPIVKKYIETEYGGSVTVSLNPELIPDNPGIKFNETVLISAQSKITLIDTWENWENLSLSNLLSRINKAITTTVDSPLNSTDSYKMILDAIRAKLQEAIQEINNCNLSNAKETMENLKCIFGNISQFLCKELQIRAEKNNLKLFFKNNPQ